MQVGRGGISQPHASKTPMSMDEILEVLPRISRIPDHLNLRHQILDVMAYLQKSITPFC